MESVIYCQGEGIREVKHRGFASELMTVSKESGVVGNRRVVLNAFRLPLH